MKYKRTFLLVEVLIALFLVTLCIVPLVREPIIMFTNEWKELEMLELERIADWTFSELKEKFLKNEIPWEKIPKYKGKTGPFFLPDVQLQLPGHRPKKISRQFILHGKGKKDGRQGEEFRQVHITLSLNKQKYRYRVPIQRK